MVIGRRCAFVLERIKRELNCAHEGVKRAQVRHNVFGVNSLSYKVHNETLTRYAVHSTSTIVVLSEIVVIKALQPTAGVIVVQLANSKKELNQRTVVVDGGVNPRQKHSVSAKMIMVKEDDIMYS